MLINLVSAHYSLRHNALDGAKLAIISDIQTFLPFFLCNKYCRRVKTSLPTIGVTGSEYRGRL